MSNFISFSEFSNLTSKNPQNAIKQQPKIQIAAPKIENDTVELNNKLKKAKEKNGIIEKIADKIKSATNIGFSSKKIENSIKNGATNEEVEKEIKDYRRSQENAAQAVGDIASGAGAIGTFFASKQGLEKLSAQKIKINNVDIKKTVKKFISKDVEKELKENSKGILKKIDIDKLIAFAKKHSTKRSSMILLAMFPAMTVGSLIKSTLLKINRIGSSEFKPEITDNMTKKEKRIAKKEAKKAKRNADFRNSTTGALNGLFAPILALGGAIATPVYLLVNSLSRYFIGTREDKGQKSLSGYVENLKSSAVINTASAVAIAIPAIKAGKFNKVFEKNIDTVVSKLQKASLEEISTGKSSYQKLEDILFENNKISSLMNDDSLDISEKIQKLSDENIFALKFKQIGSNSDKLARALKTDCPPTRTLDEAQEIINKTFAGYKIEKCVGVGTVAETYLVKDDKGREVCIKMLKDGINAEKIQKDKEKFIDMINSIENKTPEEKEFLINNVENIADGILKEVDLNNEMKAAQELAKVTKNAKVVKPIEVKDGLYVMEKAQGVTLSDMVNYTSNSWDFTNYKTKEILPREKFETKLQEAKEKLSEHKQKIEDLKKSAETEDNTYYFDMVTIIDDNGEYTHKVFRGQEGIEEQIKYLEDNKEKEIKRLENKVKEAKNKLKEYDKFIELHKLGIDDLNEDESKAMLEAYQDIIIEQFSKIDKEGKIIHGDIHPGNIFIDIKALKEGKKDFFTLIDTGNTIEQSQANAIRFLNLTNYIQNADYENIAQFVLDGAKLPQGMTKEIASQKITEELKQAFFDDKTAINKVSNDSILSITDGIMEKLGIIPADTQGNLIKSKTSANQSLEEFTKTYCGALGKRMQNNLNKKFDEDAEFSASALAAVTKESAAALKDIGANQVKYKAKTSMQEKANLSKLSPADKAKIKKSKTAPKKNSEEFLMYQLKQDKKSIDKLIEEAVNEIKLLSVELVNNASEEKLKKVTKEAEEIIDKLPDCAQKEKLKENIIDILIA